MSPQVGHLKEAPVSCDVTIIGSGIGGLVCANYLAKSGLKVVLLEKHHTVGGCASSFTRRGYYFDAGAHMMGSCQQGGQIGRVLDELGIRSSLDLIYCKPSEVVISKNKEVCIYGDKALTSSGLKDSFPKERENIENFFKFLTETNPIVLFTQLREITFSEVLDRFFDDWEIKSILSTLLGNIGLPSNRASAVTASFLFREFILHGGYYPKGGMQRFPDALLNAFIKNGGYYSLLTPVDKLHLNSVGEVKSVEFRLGGRDKRVLETKYVVANCDPLQLFHELLPDVADVVEKNGWFNRLESPSVVVVYLGVNVELTSTTKYHCNYWHYKAGHIDEYYESALNKHKWTFRKPAIFCSIPTFHDKELLPQGKHSLQCIVSAPYFEKEWWKKRGEEFTELIIDELSLIFPRLRSGIEVLECATPQTLIKYTSNFRGAASGWASVPSQIGTNRFGPNTPIRNLYTVGHWTGIPSGHSGLPTVTASGREVSRLVLRQFNRGKHSQASSTDFENSGLVN